jgi:hypothetical protein
MKSKSRRYVILFSSGLGFVLFVLANSGIGQDTYQVPTKAADIRDESDNGETDSPDKKVVYDKSGPAATQPPNPYGTSEHGGKINYGKLKERIEKTESTSDGIKKTKYGSSDATESTGAFKGSLLDSGMSLGRALAKPSASPSGSVNPLRDASASATPAPHSSVIPRSSPQASIPAAPPGEQIDLSLSLNPAAKATATPRP